MSQETEGSARHLTSPRENTVRMWDGTELFYRAWIPEEPTDKALILFHRGHEHSGRFQDVVEQLGLKNVAIFAWDARGHGRSPGDRGYAPSFACMVKDADHFVRYVSQSYGKPVENMVVMAPSVGAVLAATWVHDYAPPIRGMVLAAPAFYVKLYVPFAIPGLRLLQKLKTRAFINSYVKAKMLTHDPEQARQYSEDPLITRAIAVNILLDLHDTSCRIIEDAEAIRVPTLVLSGGADWVVSVGTQEEFFSRLGSRTKKMRVFDGMYHDLLHEKDRQLVLDEAREFITAVFEGDDRRAPLLDADKQGYTKKEYDRLSAPLPSWSPGRIRWACRKTAMETVGRLSNGIRVGLETGFDSGQSLDYIYEDRARGLLLVGKLLDRLYLDAVGWKGIRQRKVNLENLLREAIDLAGAGGEPVHLLDIATGCGRYMLETIRSMPNARLTATLRDNTPANLDAGRRLAKRMGLNCVTFEQGDAFDEESLKSIQPSPSVSVVSGLYELFPENELILRSLRGIAGAMRKGGFLVYTGQPWHPQVEMIARALPNREGKPWIMRRRTQEEMDDLVRAAGFRKIKTEVDNYGIFTVSLAEIREQQ